MKKLILISTVMVLNSSIFSFANAEEYDEEKYKEQLKVAHMQQDTARSISMTCGGTKVEIICGYNDKITELDSRVCSKNTLVFTKENSEVVTPPVPEGHDPGSTPVSLDCVKGNDDKLYVVVDYLAGSYACAKCHLESVFDIFGNMFPEHIIKISLEKQLNWTRNLKIEGR